MRTYSIAPLVLGIATFVGRARAEDKWLTGVVVEISTGHTDTGAKSNSTGSVNDGPGGLGTVNTSTTTTLTGIDYTDYTIRMPDRQFILQPYALMPHARSKILPSIFPELASVAPVPVRVSVPANVGDMVQIQAFGDRAWLRVGGQLYACAIVRQTLLSVPASTTPPEGQNTVAPQNPQALPTSNPPYDPNAPRPTLRREQ